MALFRIFISGYFLYFLISQFRDIQFYGKQLFQFELLSACHKNGAASICTALAMQAHDSTCRVLNILRKEQSPLRINFMTSWHLLILVTFDDVWRFFWDKTIIILCRILS